MPVQQKAVWPVHGGEGGEGESALRARTICRPRRSRLHAAATAADELQRRTGEWTNSEPAALFDGLLLESSPAG